MTITLKTGEKIDVVEVRHYGYGPILYYLDEKTGNKYSIDDLDINESLARDIDSRICAHLEICRETDPKRKEYKRLKYEAMDALEYIGNNICYAEGLPDRESMKRYIENNMKELNKIVSFFDFCKTLRNYEE